LWNRRRRRRMIIQQFHAESTIIVFWLLPSDAGNGNKRAGCVLLKTSINNEGLIVNVIIIVVI